MPSVFPAGIDQFVTHYDPPESLLGSIARYELLRSKTNKTPTEVQEYRQLANALAPYIFTSEELNTMQDAMVHLETYFRDHTMKQLETWKQDIEAFSNSNKQDVTDFTAQKKQEVLDYVNNLKTQTDQWVDERVYKFAYKGIYSPDVSYAKENVVRFNNSLYILFVETATGIEPTDESSWRLMMPNQKGDKGDKGDPGANLLYKGDWETGREYVIDDLVSYGGQLYRVAAAHTSSEAFDITKFEMIMNVNNLDMEVLACKLGYCYRAHDGGDVVTEKIVSGFDKANPFGDGSGETEVLKCVSTFTAETMGDKITQVYTDPNHFFDKRDTYTIVTMVSNTNDVVTYEQ